MYSLVSYREEFKSQWNSFVQEKGTIFHTIEWKEVLEDTFGYKPQYLMAQDEEGKIKAIAPLVIGRNLRFRKIGVALPFVNYLDICSEDTEVANFMNEQMHPTLSAHGLDYIELRYKDFAMEAHNLSQQEDNYTFILPLEEGEEKVMELSSSNNRNHTRKTYKNQWFKVAHDWDKLDEFYEVYSHTMKRLGSPCPSIKLFYNIRDKMGSKVTLLTVLDAESEKVIGGMTLFKWKDTVYYQWGGALESYNKKYINNYMYWEAIKYSINNGFRYLDLGRSPKDSGTFAFKSHFGAVPHKLTYYRVSKKVDKIKVIKKDDVSWAISLWKIAPKFLTDTAGKILIKYVLP